MEIYVMIELAIQTLRRAAHPIWLLIERSKRKRQKTQKLLLFLCCFVEHTRIQFSSAYSAYSHELFQFAYNLHKKYLKQIEHIPYQQIYCHPYRFRQINAVKYVFVSFPFVIQIYCQFIDTRHCMLLLCDFVRLGEIGIQMEEVSLKAGSAKYFHIKFITCTPKNVPFEAMFA